MYFSITIITFNCRELLRACLESIRARICRSGISVEIIIVDNNSGDGTTGMLEGDFQDLDIRLIRNRKNYGVARARNQAISAARGKYILILDDDTVILTPGIERMLGYMDCNPDIAVLGCKMLDRAGRFYPSARTFPSPAAVVLRRLSHYGFFADSGLLKKHYIDDGHSEDPVEADYVIGAFQLLSRIAVEKVGLLDEKMFYGFEDADYCIRAKRSGFRVMYYPAFSIRHYVQGLTKKKFFNKMMFFHTKSYMRLIRKHYLFFLKY
jgi:GT2 family glycosyltransferase